MTGGLLAVWPETWRTVWSPLSKHPEFADDIFVDLFREFVDAPSIDKPFQELADQERRAFEADTKRFEETIADAKKARVAVRDTLLPSIRSEQAAVRFLEDAYNVVGEYGDALSNSYFLRVERFLQNYSLRYDLRRPFSLHPTLEGMFSSLLDDLKRISLADAHLSNLLTDFQDAVRDLKTDTSPGRIKTCLLKQFNLAEALGQKCPGVTATTLGDICDQLNLQNVWPHATIKEALKKLYGFRSNYPGLGHAGNHAGVLREVEIRDLVALSVLLAGFVPYLAHQMDSSLVYQGV